jgi:hypothetical protein
MCDDRAMWEMFCPGGRKMPGEKSIMRSCMIMTLEQIFG